MDRALIESILAAAGSRRASVLAVLEEAGLMNEPEPVREPAPEPEPEEE